MRDEYSTGATMICSIKTIFSKQTAKEILDECADCDPPKWYTESATIRDLIKELQSVMRKHGNLPIQVNHSEPFTDLCLDLNQVNDEDDNLFPALNIMID